MKTEKLLSNLISLLLFAVPDDVVQSPQQQLNEECAAMMTKAGGNLGLRVPDGLESIWEIRIDGFDTQFKGYPTKPMANVKYATVQKQAEEAAKFLAKLYKELPIGIHELLPFQRVEIVPKHVFIGPRRTLEMSGETLIVRMGRSPLSADKIRSMWDAGKQYPLFSTDRSLWKYANPTGSAMRKVRVGLKLISKLTGDRARALRQRMAVSPGRHGLATARAEAAALTRTLMGGRRTDAYAVVIRKLQTASRSQLVKFTETLERWSEDESNIANLLASIRVESANPPANLDIELKVYMFLFFKVYGNFHWIRVTVGYGEKLVSDVISSLPKTNKFKVTFVAFLSFVGGYTVDVIDIRVMFDKLYVAEGIAEAMKVAFGHDIVDYVEL